MSAGERGHRAGVARALALALSLAPARAVALDKQGSAHGGAVGQGDEPKFGVSGAASLGVALVNPTYAARPDNTGLAFMRYALHVDIDVLGRALSFPLDVNVFSDRERRGAGKFAPTELDVIGGVTTTHAVVRGLDAELGARVEHDRPVDRGGFSQSYVDVRARGLYSLARVFPRLARDLAEGDISGTFTLGWFAVNPTYAARPDNTGNALLRYGAHVELSVAKDILSVGFDATTFTDRRTAALTPSELDATYEIIGHVGDYELHLAYERDVPLDRRGLVQSLVYGLFVYDFDFARQTTKPLRERATVPSP